MLRRLCARSLPCRACLWGRATGDGHHPCIRLHHTGRAHPARLKRDAHFQGSAGVVVSTCHDGLLAPVARAWQGATPYAVVPRDTRPHSRGAVVCVECSSKTLPACWQLCRKCSKPYTIQHLHGSVRQVCAGHAHTRVHKRNTAEKQQRVHATGRQRTFLSENGKKRKSRSTTESHAPTTLRRPKRRRVQTIAVRKIRR